jgi:pimeloyl-ACP methyl ester carboxylesterase
MTNTTRTTGYAPVNDLQLYYEIHGTGGQPILILHGAFMTAAALQPLVDKLATTRVVIAPEMQGHGHTADLDRPLNYDQMADDCAALVKHLGFTTVDVFGYSMGGHTALELAVRHPDLVRKLVVAGAAFNPDGNEPEVNAALSQLTPEILAGTPIEAAYREVAPNPEGFPTLVRKLIEFGNEYKGLTDDQIQSFKAPTLIVIGDAEGVKPEHAVHWLRLLGGGVCGDFVGVPASQLAILPGTTHYGLMFQTDLLAAIIPPFLDRDDAPNTAPQPE